MAAIQFPIADPIADPGVPQPDMQATQSHTTEPAKPRWGRTTVIVAAVGVTLVLGAALFFLRGRASAPAESSAPSHVSDFAVFATSLYLSQGFDGNEKSLAPYFLGDHDFTGIARDQWFVKSGGAVAASRSSEGVWIMSVAVELLGAVDGQPASGYVDLGVQHFTIGVIDRDGVLMATGLPTPAAAPRRAGAAAIGLGVPQADSGQVNAIATFLTAYLTGVGDVDFATATDGISPLEPAPYSTVTIRRIGVEHADDGFMAVVEVVGTDAGDRSLLGSYALRLSADWKVRAVLPALPGS
ncbi:MAG: hypothetical protein HKN07_03945 [Acidimicrobiia bacterium]|nr:hypothetical protein [Acidimicrobiia bacterium]